MKATNEKREGKKIRSPERFGFAWGKVITACDTLKVLEKAVALGIDMTIGVKCKGKFPIQPSGSDLKYHGEMVAYDGEKAAYGAKLISSIRKWGAIHEVHRVSFQLKHSTRPCSCCSDGTCSSRWLLQFSHIFAQEKFLCSGACWGSPHELGLQRHGIFCRRPFGQQRRPRRRGRRCLLRDASLGLASRSHR